MRDLELDDRFWRDALSTLAGGSRASALASRHPEYAGLLAELEADAAGDSMLIGARLASTGQNPRLLALLTAAFLARAGVHTLFVDLSSDVRWLERLLGEDFKEGIVDHTQYGVPLERCVRGTALENLAILTGGASFLAGSPLDDPPALRGALDRLRQRHGALVVTLPEDEDAADRAGLVALCDALLTIEERGASARLVGSERAVVRLTGSPQAADDLAGLTHRFLGPLPALLAGAGGMHPATSTPVGPREGVGGGGPDMSIYRVEDDDVAFLAAFEESGDASVEPAADGTSEAPGSARRNRKRRVTALGVVLAIAVLAAALGARRFAPVLGSWLDGGEGSIEEPLADLGLEKEPIPLAGTGRSGQEGTVVPLMSGDSSTVADAGPDSAGGVEVGALTGASPAASAVAGRPAPYSLHVGSYQSAASAKGVVDRLAGAGYTAFLAPVSLAAKGRWQRVYVGSFADSTAARRTLDDLLERGLVGEGEVRSTPWTFQLGTYPSREEAAERIAALRGRGIWAYAVGANPIRIYAGAYTSREEAELLARALEESTEIATLTQREL